MSDFSQVIVDVEVSADDAPTLAKIILEWLISEGIVERERSDSTLGSTDGHRPGPKHGSATGSSDTGHLDLAANGVAVVTGRTVFDAGGNGLELRCDGCGHEFEPERGWIDAVDAWWNGDDDVSFPCPACRLATRLVDWRGPWQWGFGNLGIEFWNWPPLSERFLRAVGRKLGHRSVLVRCHR